MVTRIIDRAVLEALGGRETFDAAIERARAQRLAHETAPEGTPAPTANPLIDEILDRFPEGYEVREPPEVPRTIPIEQQVIDNYQRLVADFELIRQQFRDLATQMRAALAKDEFHDSEIKRLETLINERTVQLNELEAMVNSSNPRG